MGTWIEMQRLGEIVGRYQVVPSWARGLKFTRTKADGAHDVVVPSWARGLKSGEVDQIWAEAVSCPHGHVD